MTDTATTIKQHRQTVSVHATAACLHWFVGDESLQYTIAGESDAVGCGQDNTWFAPRRAAERQRISVTITWRVTWKCTGTCTPARVHGALGDLYTSATTPPLK